VGKIIIKKTALLTNGQLGKLKDYDRKVQKGMKKFKFFLKKFF